MEICARRGESKDIVGEDTEILTEGLQCRTYNFQSVTYSTYNANMSGESLLKKDGRVCRDDAERVHLSENDSNGMHEGRHQRRVQVRLGFVEKHQRSRPGIRHELSNNMK